MLFRSGIGHALLRSELGFLERRSASVAHGHFLRRRGFFQHLLDERSQRLIGSGLDAIFERHVCPFRPVWPHTPRGRRQRDQGTSAAAGRRGSGPVLRFIMHVKQLRGKRLPTHFTLACRHQSRLFSRLVSSQIRLVVALVLFNAVLSGLVKAGAPDQPARSDRTEYDFNTDHPFSADCNNSLYCFRVLDPLVLGLIPAESESRWRGQQWLAHTATGTLTALFSAEFA